jgi:hypothetical protein
LPGSKSLVSAALLLLGKKKQIPVTIHLLETTATVAYFASAVESPFIASA